MGRDGRIYSFSNIPGRQDSPAYNVVLVDMNDGFRVMSACPGMELDASCIGMDVVASVDMEAVPPRLIFSRKS
jgi:hypothetical protein